MPKMTPYDRAVGRAHQRNERLLKHEHKRHAEKLDEIDLKLKRDLENATLLPGSLRVHDDAVVMLRIIDGRTETTKNVRFGEFVRDNGFSTKEIEALRQGLSDGERPGGGGGAAPIWEIWI